MDHYTDEASSGRDKTSPNVFIGLTQAIDQLHMSAGRCKAWPLDIMPPALVPTVRRLINGIVLRDEIIRQIEGSK